MLREILDESSIAEVYREEGRREAARLILEDRFGTLDAAMLSRLQEADAATLRSLVTHLATVRL